MTLNILMPMAGKGSRFIEKGFSIPKPLIKIRDKPIFFWALSSINNYKNEKVNLIFVVLKDHIEKFKIDKVIRNEVKKKQITIITAKEITNGPVSSCLLAKDYINNENGLLIVDCDVIFKATYFFRLIENLEKRKGKIDGILLSFPSKDSSYSYARVKDGFVIETAEKKVITTNALIGAYFFSKGKLFVKYANQMINRNSRALSEFYISNVYNFLIKDKFNVRLVESDYHYSLGTPEKLKEFLRNKFIRSFHASEASKVF